MFFPERITRIAAGHRVLEIGPGADPHPRSDVFLEMAFDDPAEYAKQFGHDRPLQTNKEVVFYDGRTFPFADGAFDYVICSHVLEHVPDVEGFLSEVFRVAPRGYMEYPLCYYDHLYNIPAHLNFLKYDGSVLRYMKKSDSSNAASAPIHAFLFDSLVKGYTRTLNDLLPYFMEGFEWEAPFRIERTQHLQELCHRGYELPPFVERPLHTYGPRRLLKELLNSIRLRGTYR